jgi:hypothetical protein
MCEEEKKKNSENTWFCTVYIGIVLVAKHFYNFLKTKMTAVTGARIKTGSARTVKALLWVLVLVLMVPLQ